MHTSSLHDWIRLHYSLFLLDQDFPFWALVCLKLALPYLYGCFVLLGIWRDNKICWLGLLLWWEWCAFRQHCLVWRKIYLRSYVSLWRGFKFSNTSFGERKASVFNMYTGLVDGYLNILIGYVYVDIWHYLHCPLLILTLFSCFSPFLALTLSSSRFFILPSLSTFYNDTTCFFPILPSLFWMVIPLMELALLLFSPATFSTNDVS